MTIWHIIVIVLIWVPLALALIESDRQYKGMVRATKEMNEMFDKLKVNE